MDVDAVNPHAEVSEDLDLGELDITTDDINFEDLEQELAKVQNHDIIANILKEECNIQNYTKDVDSTLRQVEIESIEGYISESDNLSNLNKQIQVCDDILESMEGMLGKFQNDLGSISSEIKHIQEESLTLNVKLKNRRALHEKLSNFAENMYIPASLIDTILDAEVDENFLPCLNMLHQKLHFIRTSKDAKASAAFQDVAPELGKLETKAISKVRTFLFDQFNILRKPKTNIQIQQQNRLLKLKGLVGFLKQHNHVVYKEVRSNYTETVGSILLSHFRVYLSHCQSLEIKQATRSDVIGIAEAKQAGIFSSFRGGATAQQLERAFIAGKRSNILQNLDRNAIVPHIAESQGKKFPMEAIFRSINKLLVDSSSSEYLFSTEFFEDAAVFNETMNVVLDMISENIRESTADSYDTIGLLLMIRVNHHNQMLMQKRRIPCLESFMDNLNMILWPRLKCALDYQHSSLKELDRNKGSDLKRIQVAVKHYAEITSSLVILNFGQGQLQHSLERLRSTMQNVLLSRARQLKPLAECATFLVNQYNLILSILRDAMSDPIDDAMEAENANVFGQKMLDFFEEALSSNVSLYVEEKLANHFEKMIKFVKQAETLARKIETPDGTPLEGYGPAEASPILSDFSNKWKTSIETLNRDVQDNFSSASCGKEVLKALLTQMLLYYTRFVEILKAAGPSASGLLKQSVTIPSIMYEIKRFK